MKYHNVLQQAEEDCGAACLASIAKHHGRNLSINRIRELVGTGQRGTTLLGLKRGAESIGFNVRTVKAAPETINRMSEVPLPAIIHWRGYHYVLLYGQRGKKYVIADPAVGVRYLSKKELVEGWTDKVMLLLEPDSFRFFEQSQDRVSGFGHFLKRVWPYRAVISQACLCAIVIGLLSLASPFLIQVLTDDVLVRGDTHLLNIVAIAVVVMNITSSSLNLVQSNLVAHFAQRLELGLVMEFGRQILRLPLAYYEARRSGEIASRLKDIQEINQLITRVVVSLPSQVFISIVSFSLMIFYSQKLTLFALLLVPLMLAPTLIFLPTLQQKTRKALVLNAENQGVLVETFKGALTLKTTAAAPQFWEELQSRFGSFANLVLRTVQIGIINSTFSGLVSSVGKIALLWFGSTLVINKDLSIGQLLAFNSMNDNFICLFTTLVSFVDQLARVRTATQRIAEVIEATPETAEDTKKPLAEIPGNASIICTNIHFHHAGRVDFLENFSLNIPGGKVTALIGKSGCGKSTLAKLIASLYSLQSGNIRIGNYNVQDLSLDCLRQQVILVPQEPHFWSRSIIENFRLAYPQVTFEEIIKACELVGADDFISNLPDKYQTILGEFGANISGGQRQRLAIARAIVTNPPVLILDESTAGLDPVSEAQVLERLLARRRGRTTILISHRPKVINRADWIVLLEQGKLKKQGSLDELLSYPGDHLDFLTSSKASSIQPYEFVGSYQR